jgi:putative two-component system response regulator
VSGGGTTILVVEDEPDLRDLLQEELANLGHRVLGAACAEEALSVLERIRPDLVLTDVNLGGMTGVELCSRIKRDPRLQLVPVVILTAVADLDARVAGLAAGADDFFAKPFSVLELQTRVTVLLRVKSLVDQLDRAESVISSLGMTIEARDPYTAGHCQRLARHAVALGAALGIDDGMPRDLMLASYLHDLGKVAIPDAVLLKPGPLAVEEMAVMRRHPIVGAELVQSLRTLDGVRPIIRHHHERMDGSGYPDGLAGEAIPLGARIMAVVDVYDALRTARPYKAPMSHRVALTCCAARRTRAPGTRAWSRRSSRSVPGSCRSRRRGLSARRGRGAGRRRPARAASRSRRSHRPDWRARDGPRSRYASDNRRGWSPSRPAGCAT